MHLFSREADLDAFILTFPAEEPVMAQNRTRKVRAYERPARTSRMSLVMISLVVLILQTLSGIIIL
jgi:hypothetical protein